MSIHNQRLFWFPEEKTIFEYSAVKNVIFLSARSLIEL
jgi:hypothetical protein